MKVLMVCLGNICRSPYAHAHLKALVQKENIQNIEVESAGIGAQYHQGSEPDGRSSQVAQKRNLDLSFIKATAFSPYHFDFDYLIGMDESHKNRMIEMSPKGFKGHISILLDWLPKEHVMNSKSIEDPYYGGDKGFESMADWIELGNQYFLEHLKKQL